jgi:hypothetical protein
MNKLDAYDCERSNYSFSFSDNDGKHISVSFRAEPDYDLITVFNEFKNFLIASGHDVENDIGEIHAYDESHEDDDDDSYPQSWGKEADDILVESIDAMTQHQAADKFSMENFPNNGWPFGDLTTASMPRLTTTDFASLKPIDFSSINKYPTMAPWTTEQIQALTSADIAAWSVPSPGTIGGATVSFPISGSHGGGGILK